MEEALAQSRRDYEADRQMMAGTEVMCRCGIGTLPFITPQAQRERGKVICVGVHIYMCVYSETCLVTTCIQ